MLFVAENVSVAVRASSMAFYASCETILQQASRADELSIWRARASLLKVVEEEKLLNVSHEGGDVILKQQVELAVSALESCPEGEFVINLSNKR